MIPARAFIGEFAGDVEWPTDETSGDPLALPPHGIEHHYCNLALVETMLPLSEALIIELYRRFEELEEIRP